MRTQKATVGAAGGSRSWQPQGDVPLLAALILLVALIVAGAHWPALSAQALSFDDDQYLTTNQLVRNPGWNSARRFLGEVLEPSTVGGYYQSLAMISLMADHAMGGRTDDLRPFHRTSLALHIANTALVIVLLFLLFRDPWVAAMVGLLFGVHPMTVEPIPWVGERKTLLAAFFALGCLVLYVSYGRDGNRRRYVGSLSLYMLALMSKPTSVPLPAALLLVDYWPLRRFGRRALLEKAPFFAIGIISALVTYVSQSRTSVTSLPMEYPPLRVPLILGHNIAFYLGKIVWPTGLTSHYPYPEPLALSNPAVLTGVIGSVVLSALLLASRRWTRALIVGWLIFFVMILPTMGIIGFSNVIASDKFAYLPSVGLLLTLAWALGHLWRAAERTARREFVRAGIIAAVIGLAALEIVGVRGYLVHWRDTDSLSVHMLNLAPRSPGLLNFRGVALYDRGRIDQAIEYYTEALRIAPYHLNANHNLANALVDIGRADEAIPHYRTVIRLMPRYADAHSNLGGALAMQGELDQAIVHFGEALAIAPDSVNAHHNMGVALNERGDVDGAAAEFAAALRLDPTFGPSRSALVDQLLEEHEPLAVVGAYAELLERESGDPQVPFELGNALASQGRNDEAIPFYLEALRIDPEFVAARVRLREIMSSLSTGEGP